jgi:predicted transcriptional regulator YdeE
MTLLTARAIEAKRLRAQGLIDNAEHSCYIVPGFTGKPRERSVTMEPRIETRDGLTVMGIEEPCKFDEPGFFDPLWAQHYMPRDAEIRPYSPDGGYYSLYHCKGEGQGVDVLAGMAVTGVTESPAGLVMKRVPAGRYAVIETTVANISQTWNELNERWLPQSAYERCDSPDFEYYPPNSESGSAMPVQICIPIREREKAPATMAG